MRMLFIDYNSAFNTIVPLHLTAKMMLLGFNTLFCNWVLDFLTDHPQVLRVGALPHHYYLNISDPQHRYPPEVCREPVALQHLYT